MRRAVWCLALVLAASIAGPANAYDWPVKPFDRPHPIRANFDTPRINNHRINDIGVPNNTMTFHFGVDIATTEGAAVYAIKAGTAYWYPEKPKVVVVSGNLRFEYWHITTVVHSGQSVYRHQLLGYVLPGELHMHLAEIIGGVYMDPRRPGGLTPDPDHIAPTIQSIGAFRGGSRQAVAITLIDGVAAPVVNGSARLFVNVYDQSDLIPAPPWDKVHLTPSAISWWLTAPSGKAVLPRQQTVDFRHLYYGSLTAVYAWGTMQDGKIDRAVYNFWLGPVIDFGRLAGGVYLVHIRAADVKGNTTIKAFPIKVRP